MCSSDLDSRSIGVDPAMELLLRSSIRDRLVLTAGVGISSAGRMRALETGRSWSPAGEASVALRQRIGRGRWSTTLEVGGGTWVVDGLTSSFDQQAGTWTVYAEPPQVGPGVVGRVGFGGAALRAVAVLDAPENPLWLLGVDLDVPGVITTF